MSDSQQADDWALVLQRVQGLLDRVDARLAGEVSEPDWSCSAYRWVTNQGQGRLLGLSHPQLLDLDNLLGIARQKQLLERNTRQFLAGLPANNALLWGARGTGKSSLIRGLLARYAEQGLRVIEVDRQDLVDLPDIVEPLHQREERFLIYADDLSFEADDASYKALKATMEGSLAAPPDNVLIYATSNRRHLLPEYHSENQQNQEIDGEIHPGEAVEEKVSLSERFGLWLSFHPFNQEQYLAIVEASLQRFDLGSLETQQRESALRWALQRGSRSGRVAWQFARDLAGQTGLSSRTS
ncbi:MAG: ATP-binding protein [Oceanococcus sp.]